MITRTLRASENKRLCIVHLYSSRANYGIGYTNSRHNLAGEAETYKFKDANHPIRGALSFLFLFFVLFFSFTKHNLSHYGIGYNSAAYGLHSNIWEKHV